MCWGSRPGRVLAYADMCPLLLQCWSSTSLTRLKGHHDGGSSMLCSRSDCLLENSCDWKCHTLTIICSAQWRCQPSCLLRPSTLGNLAPRHGFSRLHTSPSLYTTKHTCALPFMPIIGVRPLADQPCVSSWDAWHAFLLQCALCLACCSTTILLAVLQHYSMPMQRLQSKPSED